MVFISFPVDTTSEEETLVKKYEKLAKKRKHLEKAAKPEPEVIAKTHNKPMEAKDAKKVIEKLKKTGQLNKIIINPGKKTEFKRKIPQQQMVHQSASKSETNADPEANREAVSYDDDLFS